LPHPVSAIVAVPSPGQGRSMARLMKEGSMRVAADLDPEIMGMDSSTESDSGAVGLSRGRIMFKIGVASVVLCGVGMVLAIAAPAGGSMTSAKAVTSGLSMKAVTFDPESLASVKGTTYAAGTAKAAYAAKGVAGSDLAPPEDMNDGSFCGADEEDFEKVCYKKCSILTSGQAPKRCSAFSCGGPSSDCSISSMKDMKISVRMCDGYDVSGDSEGKSECPHKEGVCLEDEELFLGVCYKKCSILTVGVKDGPYPHRRMAHVCCRFDSFVQCFAPMNTDTNMAYNVGGGANDGDPSTPSAAHPPLMALAEAGATETPPVATAA